MPKAFLSHGTGGHSKENWFSSRTFIHLPIKIIFNEEFETLSEARRREMLVQQMSREEKQV